MESTPAKDRRLNHWATSPSTILSQRVRVTHSSFGSFWHCLTVSPMMAPLYFPNSILLHCCFV